MIGKLLDGVRGNLALLLVLVVPLLGFLPGDMSREFVVGIFLLCVLGVGCIISGLTSAIAAARVGRQLPFPGLFWQLLSNTMPSSEGEVARLTGGAKLRLLLVLSRQDNISSFENRLRCDIPSADVEIKRVALAQSAESEAEYHDSLAGADGVLFVASARNMTLTYSWVELLNWAATHAGKLVIVIRYNNDEVPTRHSFRVVPDSQPLGAVLWSVISHTAKRSEMLEHHGRVMYRAFGACSVVLLILSVAWGLVNARQEKNFRGVVENKDREIDRLGRLAGKGDSSYVAAAIETDILVRRVQIAFASSLDDKAQPTAEIRQFMDQIARNIQKDLHARHGLNTSAPYEGHVDIWRRVTRDGQDVAVRVGCSSPRKSSWFAVDGKSILGGAYRNPNRLVVWRANAEVGATAVWNLTGDACGKFANGSEIRFDSNDVCVYQDRQGKGTGTDQHTKQLMCFAWSGGTDRAEVAVSVDTPLTDDFLNSEWTRRYLVSVVGHLQVIPDRLLIPKAELDNIFSAKVKRE